MWNPPTKKQLEKIPALYATDGVPFEEKKVHMHFFFGSCDWWLVEYDAENDEGFGYAIINGDEQNAEWGYISLAELRTIKVGFVEIDREIHFKAKKAGEIAQINCL